MKRLFGLSVIVTARMCKPSVARFPMYGGYRAVKGVIRRDRLGNKIQSFPAVIDKDLLDFAYGRLATTDLDGKPLENGRTPNRHFHKGHDNESQYGLLKFRILSDQGDVRLHRGTKKTGVYRIVKESDGFLGDIDYVAEAGCSEIDTPVVTRLLERAEELNKAGIETNTEEVNQTRRLKIAHIVNTLEDIEIQQEGLTRTVGRVEIEISRAAAIKDKDTVEIKEKRLQLLEQEIETLEKERRRLLKLKAELDEDDDDVLDLDYELIRLNEGWDNYDFKKRRSLLNLAIQEVRINRVSTHWMEIQVIWLKEEWGREHMYFRRRYGGLKDWNEEEKEIMRRHYPTMPTPELLVLLPERSLASIRSCSQHLAGLGKRTTRNLLEYNIHDSYTDVQFRESNGILDKVAYTKWEGL